jgi:hypothetical protein
MKSAALLLCAALWAAPLANAQKLDLKFDALAAKAASKVELDISGALLKLATRFARDADATDLLSGVKAVHIRNYEFRSFGAYTQKDLEPLRNQISGQSRWSKIVNIKEDETTTEIYIATDGDKIGGCVVIAAGEDELSIIYLEGTFTLAQVKRLGDEGARHELGGLFGDH